MSEALKAILCVVFATGFIGGYVFGILELGSGNGLLSLAGFAWAYVSGSALVRLVNS